MNVQHENGRFFVDLNGKQAELLYRVNNGKMEMYRTFTPPELRGRGIAEQVALAAFEYAKKQRLKVVPACSYVADTFLKKHAEFRDIIEV